MALDILGYRDKHKDFYGDMPLDDVAKDAFQRGGYSKKTPDYDTWKKESGIDVDIEADRRRRNPTFEDKLRMATDHVAPKESSSILRRAIGDPLASLAKGAIIGIPEAIIGLADIPTMGYAGKGFTKLMRGRTFQDSRESFDAQFLSPEAIEAQEKVSQAKGFTETIKTAVQNPSSIVSTIMESAPSMVGGAAIGRMAMKGIGKAVTAKGITEAEKISRAIAAGAVGEGLISAGQNTEQLRQGIESGTLSPAQVAAMAGSGFVTGLISRMSAGLAKRLSIVDVDTLLAGANTGKVFDSAKTVLKGIIGSAITEGALEELPQSAQEQMAQNIATGKPILDGVAEAAAMGLLSGAGMGMMGAGSVALTQKREPKTYDDAVNKLRNAAYIMDVLDSGLKTGEFNGKPFTDKNAVELINESIKTGIYTEDYIDRFKDRYPQLRDGLNGLIADNVTKKIDEAVTNTLTNTAQNLSDIPINKPDVRKEELPPGAATTVKKLQDQITRQEDYLARNANRKGETQYEKWVADLEQKKAKLTELTGGDQNGTLQTETTVEDLLAEQDKMEWKNKPVGKERDDALLEQRKRADQIGSLLKIGDIILDHNGDYFGTIEHTDKTGVTFAKDDENPNGAFIARKEFDSNFIPDRDNGSHFSVKHSQGTAEENKGSRKPLNAPPAPLSQTDAATVGKGKEKIVSAVTEIDGKIYEGITHSESIQKAIDAGDIIETSDGYTDKEGNDLWGTGHSDLFKTSTGRVINRFQADREFGITAGEDLVEGKTQAPPERYKVIDEVKAGESLKSAPEAKKGKGVKEEFKVGDVLDPQGKTNMVGKVTIKEIQGNTLKFVDSEGTEFSGMQKSIVRDLVKGGSWKKEQQTTAPEEGQAAKTEVTGKQPYELSRAEYVQAGGLKMKGRAAEHKKAVAQAIAEGKITEHQDYPELRAASAPQNLTAVNVINDGFNKIKAKIGEKKAQEYFKQADKLINPNQNNIVEYRSNGIVTKDGNSYTFHALSGMDTNNWRIAFTNDITEQFTAPQIEATEPKEIFIRAAEKRDLARVKKSLKEIPDKFGYEKVYQKKGKQGRGFYYVKMKVKEVKAEKQAPPPSGAENLVTFLQRSGKVKLGEEFQDKTGDAWSRAHGFRSKDRSREMGDIADVTSKNGKMAMDEAASFVNAEGFRDKNGSKFTDRTLFEVLAAGEGRNILHPGKAERIIEKQIEEKENEYWSEREEEYLDQQREALAQEGIDATREIEENSESVRADLISEIEAEGNLTEEQLEAAHDEISSFFDEMSKAEETPRTETTDAGEQHTLAGLSAAETFTLTAKEPETPVVKGAKLTPKNLQPKEKIGDMFAEKAEQKADKLIEAGITIVKKEIDLSTKSTGDLVKDMFAIINDHLGERGSISTKEVDETLYQKLKPFLAEIVSRAKAKMMDARAYLFGAVDAMPDGKAKDIYEAAAERYTQEPEKQKLTYEQFAEQYQDAFKQGNKYKPSEVGFNHYTDIMVNLADDYPAYLERFEAEVDAEAAAPVGQSTDLSAYGLTVTKSKTNNGKDVWNVSGKETRTWKDTIKQVGGRWYGPRKVWSFYNGDPTNDLLAALPPIGEVHSAVRQDEATSAQSPYSKVADMVMAKLSAQQKFTRNELFFMCKDAFGGTLAEGKFSAKDAYDALEMGINKYLENSPLEFPTENKDAVHVIENLKSMFDLIPTQTTRTEEMDEFQQFSTPPALAFAANWVANLKDNDVYLEPSAGTGNLAIFGRIAGVKEIIVNELAPRRAAILKELGFDKVYTENAEQINNILPQEDKPTVVVMNPPFSSTAGRMKGERKTVNATVHIEQALKRLQPGGRLVGIVGEGMAADKPAFAKWWKEIARSYQVRANIGISGKEYAKYGTVFDNQIIVIDKPLTIDNSKEKSIIQVTGKVDKIEDLINLLEGVRNERINPGEQRATQSGEQEGAPITETATGRNGAVLPATGGILPKEQSGRSGRTADNNTRRNEGLETGGRNDLSGTRPGNKRGKGRRGLETGQQQPERTGGSDTSGNTRQSDNNAPLLPEEEISGLTVEQRADVEKNDELTDAVYNTYTPAKLKIPNSKEHPGKLVESAAMASVEPIDPTYSPKLPEKAIKSGAISIAQLEAVVYAGQAHSEILPNGERKGYFIGDGTGVGKGREIAAILWDNWNQGRRKAVWLSQNSPLMKDAQRDIAGVGWDKGLVFDIQKTKLQESIKQKEGIGFVGYGTLRTKKVISGKEISRLDQLVRWLGKDFDGCIIFDESHNMGNALPIKGKRGTSKPSATALAGIELQKQLPKARVVYVSATGATEVMNLAYAERLGLWGDKTPFPNSTSFVTSIAAGGITAMEMVAMNMKANGVYLARSLAYDDVKYERLQHDLTPEQRKIYDELAGAWAIAQRDIDSAMKATGITDEEKTLNGDAKSHVMSAFWGTNQRFWNQIITSMQMPTVIKSIEKDIAAGHAPLIQLINTNEAAQKRAISGMEEDDTLENLDITPKEMLIEYVNNSFPVHQFEKYTDEDGNEKSRIVVDSKGNTVLNAEAVRIKEELLTKLASIRVPDGPLEIILDHFGVENVAEVTGRSRRVVYKDTKDGRKRVVEAWGKNKGMADADAFMNDKKKILIFSQAGGTGRSYHADNTAKNKRLRRHYLVQPGWRADVAVQGLGRSHRTNQAQAPEWVLVTTDLEGQKRFISSIARRLSQLGALTKGSRETGNQGLFNSRDNLESQEAKDAFHQLLKDIYHNEIPDMSMGEFMEITGLNNIIDKETGALNVTNLPEINQFLNRILNMKIDVQNRMFGEFAKRLNIKVAQAIENGTLDVGVETIRAKKTEKMNEQVVYEDPKTKAKATYLEVELTHDAKLLPYENTHAYNQYGYVQNIRSGRIWALAHQKSKTDSETGDVTPHFSAVGANYNYQDISDKDVNDPEKYRKIPKTEAKPLWDADYNKMPKEVKERIHMVTGSILPIWDRLPQGEGTNKIYRMQVDGKNIIGRVIQNKYLDSTLKKLNAQRKQANYNPQDIFNNVLHHGYSYELSNNWEIKRRKVADDYRIELDGPDYIHTDELKKYGIFTERISYTTRYFIPADEKGITAIKEIISSRPVVEEISSGKKKGQVTTKDVEFMHDTGEYAIQEKGAYQMPTIADVQDVFKGQEVSEINGGFLIKTHAGEVFVESVNSIDANTAALNIGYSKGKLSEKEVIAGKYDKGVISLVKGAADKFTLSHESVHYMEDIGVISPSETSLLKRHIQNLVSDGKFETVNEKDIGGAEDRANFLADALTKEPRGLLGRILNKIHDFIDKLVNAFGIRTIRGITRDVETGNIYSRPTEAQREAWLDLNTESYNTATMAEPFYSQLFNTVTSKIKEMPSKVQSIVPWLNKNNVKPAEMKWMGVEQWLAENQKDGRIDKQAFADFLKENQIEIKEVTKEEKVKPLSRTERDRLVELTDKAMDGQGHYKTSLLNQSEQKELDELNRRDSGYSEDSTKFAAYQLPGGENYRELLLTLPLEKLQGANQDIIDKASDDIREVLARHNELTEDAEAAIDKWWKNPTEENSREVYDVTGEDTDLYTKSSHVLANVNNQYRSAHWDEPNVLAHVRMNDRVDADGNKVLFLEEVQSDWHQEGKKKGYQGKEILTKLPEGFEIQEPTKFNKYWSVYAPKGYDGALQTYRIGHGVDKEDAIQEALGNINRDKKGVPPAPFADNWHEMVMKRMLRYAAENGYDKIAWTTGEQQIDRYEEALRQNVDEIRYEPAGEGLWEISAYKNGKSTFNEDEAGIERIKELLGKDIADKIVRDQGTLLPNQPYREWRSISGEGLAIGGEGMKSFYDNLIPGFMNKYVKQWGGKVGEIMIPASEPLERGYLATATVPSVDITDQMKHDVLFKGQSFYNVAGNKNWQWWKNRDWQKEMLALPKKFWEGNTRDFIKEGYIPITRDEADNLYKEDIGEFVSWVMIRGDKTTGIEGIFIKPLSYQGYEPYHYKEKTHYRNQEAYQKYQGFKDRYLRGNAGELAGQGGRGASAVQQYSIRKMEDPPVSKDPKVLNLYLKDETDAIVQTITNKFHPKSMTWLETMLKSPEWFDHPQIQNIVKLFMRDRNEIYHETFNDLNMTDDKEAPENTVTEAAKALRNKGLSLTERLSGKVSPEYQTLMDMIDDGDTRWVRNKKIPLATQLKHFEDAWRKKGATDEIINVWRSFRQSYDKALDLMTKQLRDMIEEIKEEAKAKGEKPDLSELNQTLKGALAQMEEWRGFYAPRQRRGNWAVQAYKEHGPLEQNREWYRAHHVSELSAQREAKKLERDGWKIYKVGETEKLPESVYQDVRAVSTAKLIDAALDKLGKKIDLDQMATFNAEILREVSDMIKSRGFRSTMIHRGRGNVVRGFIEDPIERHLMYINSVSGGISKARVARMAMQELLGDKEMGEPGIDPVKEPKAFSVAQDYIQEQLRNADASDRIIGLAKSIATFKFLGFNLRSLAVNTTAILTTAPAAIHQYATSGKGSMTEIFRELAKAGKDYGAAMAGKDLGNPDEAAFIADVHKKGWDDAQYTREALGEISKIHSKVWSTMMDASMYLFGVSEKWNRGTTMLAAYRLARKNGMSHDQAAETAKTSSDKAHGVYGKSTMPMWAQGTNPAAKLGQMMYVYSKFGHNYLQMLYDMGFKKKNIKGAMFAFLSPLVLAGGAAFPFKDAIFGFAGFILGLLGFDRDPEKWVWDQIREHLGGDAEKFGRHGLTGAMGVDISGSLSIGVGVPKDFIDLTGAIGGVVTEITEAGASLANREPGRAAEHLLPTGLANPLRAMRESKEGATTRNRRRVWDEKGKPYVPGTGASIARGFGFRSTEQAVLSERTWEGHREQGKISDRRNSIYERYRAWMLGGRDRDEYKKIVKEVQDFNRFIRENRLRGESYITSQSLKNQARRMMRPSKKERSILEN